MRQFARLYESLESTTRTVEKVRVLVEYFAAAAPADAAWALFFLTGQKIKRAVNTRLLREWAAREADLPLWLIEECYDVVGDLSEALALLLPDAQEILDIPLHRMVEQRIVPLQTLSLDAQHEMVALTWRQLDSRQRLVWHKMLMGEFRMGAARTLVERALAEVAAVSKAEMARRLMGPWEPTADFYSSLLADVAGESISRPYPFFLAQPLPGDPADLGSFQQWEAEWKWDGIRAQLIRRRGEIFLWSRGEELITDRFPEVASAAKMLPEGTVLDGEILAWGEQQPLPFALLQRRIGRRAVSRKLLADIPVVLMAFDILEYDGHDIRSELWAMRRELLEIIVTPMPSDFVLRVSPLVNADSWESLKRRYEESRNHNAEGLMLKKRDAAYGVGRPRGIWWKWKSQPFTVDAVLIYAQRGHGRRASLYTDYTFGVWKNGALVPFAKAYSGLTDEEIREVDRFIREHTLEKHGPVRIVEPQLVFELHFEGIQLSRRHKSGLAVRFPRIGRWRHDKAPLEADSIDTIQALLQKNISPRPPSAPQLF